MVVFLGRLTAAFRGSAGFPSGPAETGAVRAKHPTGVYLRGSRLQGVSLDPFGTVTYASPNGATPLRDRDLRSTFFFYRKKKVSKASPR